MDSCSQFCIENISEKNFRILKRVLNTCCAVYFTIRSAQKFDNDLIENILLLLFMFMLYFSDDTSIYWPALRPLYTNIVIILLLYNNIVFVYACRPAMMIPNINRSFISSRPVVSLILAILYIRYLYCTRRGLWSK